MPSINTIPSNTNTRISLMKAQESHVKTYFEQCFCKRDFENLSEWLDENYRAYVKVTVDSDTNSSCTSESESQFNFKPVQGITSPDGALYKTLMKITNTDSIMTVTSCIFHPINVTSESEDDKMVIEPTSSTMTSDLRLLNEVKNSEAWKEQLEFQFNKKDIKASEGGTNCSDQDYDPECFQQNPQVEDWLCKSEITVQSKNSKDAEDVTCVVHKKLWLFNRQTGKLTASWPA